MQSVGRPREFDEADVLDKVMDVFWAQGYEGTGMSDIMSATGLTKGSLYKAFTNKHTLYLKALERYEERHVNAMVTTLEVGEDPRAQIEMFLDAPIKDAEAAGPNRGCFLCNASADRADFDEATRARVKRGFHKLAAPLTKLAAALSPEGKPAQAEESAQMLLAVYAGMRIMSRSGLDLNQLQATKRAALRAIGG